MADKIIYLDHNATTPLHPEVIKELESSFKLYGNPSSMHSLGRESRKKIEKAREITASIINADPDEIVFVGSGSEANNTVLNLIICRGKLCRGILFSRSEIITTQIEHPAIMDTSKCLNKQGVKVHFLHVDKYGKVDTNELKELISDKTAIVSVMMANNEIGTIQDIKKIAQIAHDNGALIHTDAVQAVGKIPVNVQDLNVDFLSFSGHKIYGPKGVGVLYVRYSSPFCPFIHGGHQETGRRAGTENTLGIIGLGKAVEMAMHEFDDLNTHYKLLKNKLKTGIEKNIPDVKINGHPEDCLPQTLNVSFIGAEGEAILLYLDLAGIAVSTGSACASGSLDPSHVLLATGLGPELAHGSIRMSLGRGNTEEDIDYVLEKLPQVIEKIRKMSTVYKGAKNE